MNDPESLRASSDLSGKSPDEIRAWYAKAIEYHTAMVRKWLGRCDIAATSEERMVAMTADAMLLSADLLLSYPAASGTTAFDRLARTISHR